MKTMNFRFFAFKLLAASLAVLGSLGIHPANAAPKTNTVYIPPANMVVACNDGGIDTAITTANVPRLTKFITYSFYVNDPYYWSKTYDPNAPDAYFGFESGPGWPAATDWAYTTMVGGDGFPIPAPRNATAVWAAAYSSTKPGAKPLAWGFAPCGFGVTSITYNMWVTSGSTNFIRYTDGTILVQP